MSRLYPDTHPRMEDLQVQMWRLASPTRKMHMLAELNATLRTLALAGLRARYPQATQTELHRRLVHLLLGEEVARQLSGEVVMQGEPLEVTLKVTQVLERLGIAYLIGGSLDMEYLKRWARDLGIGDLLERALAEVES